MLKTRLNLSITIIFAILSLTILLISSSTKESDSVSVNGALVSAPVPGFGVQGTIGPEAAPNRNCNNVNANGTCYVCSTSSCSPNGNWKDVIKNADPGDVILLSGGTYSVGGSLKIGAGSSSKPVMLTNFNSENVVIDGRVEVASGGNVIVEGVTIETESEGYAVYLRNTSSSNPISNITFKNVAIYGGLTEAIRIQGNVDNVRIENGYLDGGKNNHVVKILCDDTGNEPSSCDFIPDNIVVHNNRFSKVSAMFNGVCGDEGSGGSGDLIQLEGAGDVEITNNNFSNNPFEDCLDIKGEGRPGTNLLIKNNYIDSTGGASQSCGTEFAGCRIEGLMIHGSQHTGDVNIEGNYFKNGGNRFRTLSEGVRIQNNVFDGSKVVIEDGDADFIHNTLIGNSDCNSAFENDCNQLKLGGTSSANNVTIANNILDGTKIDHKSGQYSVINNIIYETFGDVLGNCSGCTKVRNLSVNPLLNGIYLTESSPAIDSADISYSLMTDALSMGRPSGNIPDIGAIEYTTNTGGSSICGNGSIEVGEQCDDGNTNNSDGCSSICQVEMQAQDYAHDIGDSYFLIEAENYNNGGNGVGYNDVDTENRGGAYRTDGVDIKQESSNNYAIGWMNTGEWLKYTVDVPQSGTYGLKIRYATAETNARLGIQVDGVELSQFNLPTTTSYDTYQVLNVELGNITGGAKTIQLDVVQQYVDVDSMLFEVVETSLPEGGIVLPDSGPLSGTDTLTCGPVDADANGIINITDFSNFALKYLKSCIDVNINYDGCGAVDANVDGKIDIVDFANFASIYGDEC